MSTTIDQAFVKHFQTEVHTAYQRMGSKLRSTVRTKGGVRGSSTTFQKVGKGTASTKARHGAVPVMNVDHTPVECSLADYYAGDWVDELDELKVNIDEQMVVANAGAYALGRKTDELIIAALDTATAEAKDSGTDLTDNDPLTKAKVLMALEMLGDADVPDDGQRYAVVGWKQWSDLLGIEAFANADYVGDDGVEIPKAYIKFGPLTFHNNVSITDSGRDARVVGHVDLLVYADATARQEDKPAVRVLTEQPPHDVRQQIVAAADRDAALSILYGWVKTLDRFQGASDV